MASDMKIVIFYMENDIFHWLVTYHHNLRALNGLAVRLHDEWSPEKCYTFLLTKICVAESLPLLTMKNRRGLGVRTSVFGIYILF